MRKEIIREGSPSTKFISMMREYGWNQEITIELGTVVNVAPLEIHIESDGLTLDQDDLIMCESLLKHTRVVSIEGIVANKPMIIESKLKVDDQVILIENEETQQYFVMDKVGV